jgi:outer membrane protein assembly factor BamA
MFFEYFPEEIPIRSSVPVLFAIFFLFAPFSYSNSCLILNDSMVSVCAGEPGFSCRKLQKSVLLIQSGLRHLFIKNYLDSLGFFYQKWDTLSADSIKISPGARCLILSEQILGADSSLTGEGTGISYPFLYDAGLIRERVEQVSRSLAEKGYPFASIAIDIKREPHSDECNTDSASIMFTVRLDQKCVVSSPLLTGKYTTSKKVLLNDITLKKGEIFNYAKIKESEIRLKSRSYITDVVASGPEIDSISSDSDKYKVFVPFFIKDKSGLGLDGAAGVEASNGGKPLFHGDFVFSLMNLFHSGESGTFEYAGNKKQQMLNFEIAKPWLFNLPLTIEAGAGLEIIKDEYGYLSGMLKALYEIGIKWQVGFSVKGNEITPVNDSIGEAGTFYGGDFIIKRMTELYKKGQFSQELSIETGSGIAKKERVYSRSHIDFAIGVHVPVLLKQSVVARIVSGYLITNEQKLAPAEMYRIGGRNSIRGYSENEFPFRTFAFGQLEYHLYFKNTGSVYIFTDGGFGFQNDVSLKSDYEKLVGYGLGVRLPSTVGSMTLEWARNFQERKGLGRVHVRFQNSLSKKTNKKLSGF